MQLDLGRTASKYGEKCISLERERATAHTGPREERKPLAFPRKCPPPPTSKRHGHHSLGGHPHHLGSTHCLSWRLPGQLPPLSRGAGASYGIGQAGSTYTHTHGASQSAPKAAQRHNREPPHAQMQAGLGAAAQYLMAVLQEALQLQVVTEALPSLLSQADVVLAPAKREGGSGWAARGSGQVYGEGGGKPALP